LAENGGRRGRKETWEVPILVGQIGGGKSGWGGCGDLSSTQRVRINRKLQLGDRIGGGEAQTKQRREYFLTIYALDKNSELLREKTIRSSTVET